MAGNLEEVVDSEAAATEVNYIFLLYLSGVKLKTILYFKYTPYI